MITPIAILFLALNISEAIKHRANGMLENGQTLLGNTNYPAISYSGHRKVPRSVENTPSLDETKEDMRILEAMGIRLLRTYNAHEFPHAERTLQAIRELKAEDPQFEMYVMLGAWIQCKNAYQEGTDHSREDEGWNQTEIEAAIRLASAYPDIVKIIAVGNEAMVTWQTHFVPSSTILKWVMALKNARTEGRIPQGTLITSSDNWAALGGEPQYRNDDLAELLKQMDFISLHTYAFHDTYYNPALQWAIQPEEMSLPITEQHMKSVDRAIDLQKVQVKAVEDYLAELGLEKEIHIGETGWASLDNAFYGIEGTGAAYEYTTKLFYDAVIKWTRAENMSCFYFEAFDEPWKSKGTAGSEGHFGLFTLNGEAKYPVWNLVDKGCFDGLTRGGHPIIKTHGGDISALQKKLKSPKHKKH